MGTITPRKRKDGSTGYTAQIRIKQDGKAVHTEAQTFDREAAAKVWVKKRETELSEPGAIEQLKMPDPPLADVIDHYLRDTKRAPGKTKMQVLRTIKGTAIGALKCSHIRSTHIVTFAQSLGTQPQTVGNYVSHLASVFRVARPAWGYKLDMQQMDDARTVMVKLGIISKSKQRDRRPSLAELDKLMSHFGVIRHKRKDSVPMQELIAYAIFSTRRESEITRQTFEDLDEAHSEIWVRDMKHPGEKIGNDALLKLEPPALALILKRRTTPDQTGRIYPYNADTISTAFTRACQFLGIENLTFHDLRHEGISRLFEMGRNIPQASQVSGHRTWASLKRYAHLRQTGDKFASWPWFERLGLDIKAEPKTQKSPTQP